MRDVIQVERAGKTGDASGNIAELARVADELLPPLVARLGVSDLGEIEVRQGTWRVRIRRTAADSRAATAPASPATGHATAGAPGTGAPAASHASAAASHASAAVSHASAAASHAAGATPSDHQSALSTAVGYFALQSGLAVGHRVSRGDVLGWVDVLGMRKEIVSPADGVIGRFVTEPGDPVEYGQELVALIAATSAAAAPGAEPGGPGDASDGVGAADALGGGAAADVSDGGAGGIPAGPA